MDDFLRGLVSFGIRQTGSRGFIEQVDKFITNELETLTPKMIENLLFFFSRVGSGRDYYLIQSLLQKVQDKHMIENGQCRDHVMLMNICNMYRFDMPRLWEQIEKQFSNTFLKQQV